MMPYVFWLVFLYSNGTYKATPSTEFATLAECLGAASSGLKATADTYTDNSSEGKILTVCLRKGVRP